MTNRNNAKTIGKKAWPQDEVELALERLAERQPDKFDELRNLKELKQLSGWTMKELNLLWKRVEKDASTVARPNQQPKIVMTVEDQALGMQHAQLPNMFRVFHTALNATGYKAHSSLSGGLLLMIGSTLLGKSGVFMFTGDSSSGKSSAALGASRFLPPERVHVITKVSQQWFYYAGGESGQDLKHKLVVMGEINPLKPGEDDPRQEAMRQLISENFLKSGSVEKDNLGRNRKTEKYVYGPCQMAATTTTRPNNWDDQLVNRAAWINIDHTDESVGEVLHIKATQGSISAAPWESNADGLKKQLRQWHNYFRLLRQLEPDYPISPDLLGTAERGSKQSDHTTSKVLGATAEGDQADERLKNTFSGIQIPYAERIILEGRHVTVMRAYDLLQNFIAISALLHQHNRTITEVDGKDYLVATEQDYRNVVALFEWMVPKVTQQASPAVLRVFEALEPWLKAEEQSKSYAEIAAFLKAVPKTTGTHVRDLVKAELLVEDTAKLKSSGDRKKYFNLAANYKDVKATIQLQGDLGIVDPNSIFSTVANSASGSADDLKATTVDSLDHSAANSALNSTEQISAANEEVSDLDLDDFNPDSWTHLPDEEHPYVAF